ncbi:chemotaxis protein CheA [Ohessyouella blattaphilus]|uniref:Chemotaxis protein CheA n=1 Tax=Ohessyouella blattaphilus TaxID=2949333 RepID=A0ABT1EEP0_9FIRM|nr:chemotaxis protein CheA [Ohessyouella blattaphilus]MCP1109108.1 chemotaxis protein CheA [Ohessyouella blattaphilus]MCR8562502.1 chemotaxis protein CheA [Ohessyouella blattaphilus]
MDNVNDTLLEAYLFETDSLLAELDDLLISAEQEGTFSVDETNQIFRNMHTIKGSSAMLEYHSLMEIAHHIEDLFFYIRENGMDSLSGKQRNQLFELMFDSMDTLRLEYEKVKADLPLSQDTDGLTLKINTFIKKLKGEALPTKTEVDTIDDKHSYQVLINFDTDCGMENLRAFMLVSALEGEGLAFTYSPKDVETNAASSETIIDQGFKLFFDSESLAKEAIETIKNSGSIRSYELIQPKLAAITEDEPSVTAEVNEAKPEKAIPKANIKQDLINVSLNKLDKLIAVVGEIVITESMVVAIPERLGLKDDSFLKSARQLRKLTDELQDIAMSLRMVPVSGVFQRMNRIVRDMNKSLGKNVKLTLIGSDTEVDKTIVDGISDPLMHIVRNAIDHGIESPEARLQAGKEEQPEVTLSASHTGSEVIITVTDNGQGMDTEAILKKAEKNGLLTKPADAYSKKEILSLLMLPGFSTNHEVTEYSGRGVGLDVVKKNVESIGGTVIITSEQGQGSTTTLKIPLTLAIVDGMDVSVGKEIFTLPIANIKQSFKATNTDVIRDAKGQEIIKYLNDFFPVVRLRDLLQLENGVTDMEDGILIWVESGEHSYCLFVDNLIGEQQVVVKPLPTYLNNFRIKDYGISGCTILGDGSISIILDVGGIYSAFTGDQNTRNISEV